MRETEFKEIDGDKYICTMMPATKAQLIFVEVVQRIGSPAMAMLSKAFQPAIASDGTVTEGMDANTVEGLVMEGLRIFILELEPATADRIIKTVMDGVKFEGGKAGLDDVATFDQHFRGRVLTIYRVFAWAMEVNYRDFFDAADLNRISPMLRSAATKAWSGLTPSPPSEDSSSDQKGTST